MVTLEQVEKIRVTANVSYADAKEALEQSGGNLLDAMIYLEKQGKVASATGAFYTTYNQNAVNFSYPSQENTIPTGVENITFGTRFMNACRMIWAWLSENYLVISKENKEVWRIPIFVVFIIFYFGFYVAIPLIILSFFYGYKYSLAETKNVANFNDIIKGIQESFQKNNLF